MYVCAHVYVHIQSMCNSYVCMHVDECVGAGVHVCKGQRSTSSVISQSPFILRHGLSLVSACQVSPRDPWVFTSPALGFLGVQISSLYLHSKQSARRALY